MYRLIYFNDVIFEKIQGTKNIILWIFNGSKQICPKNFWFFLYFYSLKQISKKFQWMSLTVLNYYEISYITFSTKTSLTPLLFLRIYFKECFDFLSIVFFIKIYLIHSYHFIDLFQVCFKNILSFFIKIPLLLAIFINLF